MQGMEAEASARADVAKMKPEWLSAVDEALSKEWVDVEKYAHYAEKPLEELFRTFVQREYYKKLSEVIVGGIKADAALFPAAHDVGVCGADVETHASRRALIAQACQRDAPAVEDAI